MLQGSIEQLKRIYNTLTLVSTKGEDTILMGQCLQALSQEIINMQVEIKSRQDIKELEENG